MAKRRQESPKLLFVVAAWNGRKVLEPAVPWTEEAMVIYTVGSVVEIQLWQNRSLPQHNLYWGVLAECVANSENKYGSAEDLHSALKVALGYRRELKMLTDGVGYTILTRVGDGLNRIGMFIQRASPYVPLQWRGPIVKVFDETADLVESLRDHISDTLILPGSISFDKMDAAEFKVYFDRAMGELTKAGYPAEEYIQIVKQKLRGIRVRTDDGGRSEAPANSNSRAEEDAEAQKAAA